MQNNKNNKLTKEWIDKAQNDLETAKILLRENGPTDTLCFHCHQAVEKYLKGCLVFNNIYFEKIHNLWSLSKLLGKVNKGILKFEKEIKTLDAYYIESRYPPSPGAYTHQECKEAVDYAEKIIKYLIKSMR